jgi:transcriptional regulator with XRE-family HTH domain
MRYDWLIQWQRHGRVAFLPFVGVRLKTAKFLEFASNPETFGEHLKRKRLQANKLQREAAEQIGACHTADLQWETAQNLPFVRYYPAIIAFLGYEPGPVATSRQEQLIQFRCRHGMTIRQAALAANVDAGTWGRREIADRSELPETYPKPSWARITATVSDQKES